MTMLATYCERAGTAGLLAEPINLITNTAFVIAAVFAARRLVAKPDLGLRNSWDLGLLILLLGAIGIGSALWHSFATVWAVLADVIPITLFINLYLLSFGWRVLRLRPLALAGLWLGYQVLSVGLVALTGPELLNGSVGYLPALAFLVGFWWVLRRRADPLAPTLLAACLLFIGSLTFRTLDMALCGLMPLGLHFLWHLLNALLLYLLLRGLIGAHRA
ncbi:MAG: ceramidase domain-containing protein [Lamprobacter sp.]|uniref:ceramidase domain-containing protein n=1 Tax=Lamprobacter sp. TaxID=3100796 RepID=UPI002B25F852|nr:ceramidase domain-containing protein [Lamprobacter sp.]MEA3640588.1 ceramidase domain-containing protein [Lamprobacter sp.]